GVSLYRVSLPILGLGIGIAGWLTIVFTEWPPAGPYWVPALLSVDRKSTRLNSSHVSRSYAVFCLKKKNHNDFTDTAQPTTEQLVGRLWLRVPRAGSALVLLRRPRHAGIAGGGLAALLVLPGVGTATRRRRRRRTAEPARTGAKLEAAAALLWAGLVAAAC